MGGDCTSGPEKAGLKNDCCGKGLVRYPSIRLQDVPWHAGLERPAALMPCPWYPKVRTAAVVLRESSGAPSI